MKRPIEMATVCEADAYATSMRGTNQPHNVGPEQSLRAYCITLGFPFGICLTFLRHYS